MPVFRRGSGLTDGYFNLCLHAVLFEARCHRSWNVFATSFPEAPKAENKPVLKVGRPLIYIAGPFRADPPWEIEQNIRRAEEHGLSVAKLGGIPVIPHTMYRFYRDSLPDAFWLEAGIALLRTCDAVAVAVDRERAQSSSGTVAEIGDAINRNIPVFYNKPNTLLDIWIADWIKEHTV